RRVEALAAGGDRGAVPGALVVVVLELGADAGHLQAQAADAGQQAPVGRAGGWRRPRRGRRAGSGPAVWSAGRPWPGCRQREAPPVKGGSPSFRGRKRSADQTASTATCPLGRSPYSPAMGQSVSRLMSALLPFG